MQLQPYIAVLQENLRICEQGILLLPIPIGLLWLISSINASRHIHSHVFGSSPASALVPDGIWNLRYNRLKRLIVASAFTSIANSLNAELTWCAHQLTSNLIFKGT